MDCADTARLGLQGLLDRGQLTADRVEHLIEHVVDLRPDALSDA